MTLQVPVGSQSTNQCVSRPAVTGLGWKSDSKGDGGFGSQGRGSRQRL